MEPQKVYKHTHLNTPQPHPLCGNLPRVSRQMIGAVNFFRILFEESFWKIQLGQITSKGSIDHNSYGYPHIYQLTDIYVQFFLLFA